jgi:hypothetical protein
MSSDIAPILVDERKFYEQERAHLLSQHEGKFALIHGKKLLGVYDTGRAAYEEGLRRLGNVPMLIVHVVRQEPVETVSPALQLGLIGARPYS